MGDHLDHSGYPRHMTPIGRGFCQNKPSPLSLSGPETSSSSEVTTSPQGSIRLAKN